MSKCYDTNKMKEAVCIETQKIYDSCRDKDCIENLRVYLSPCCQELLDNAVSIKPKKASVIWVYTDVEPVAFRRGYYSLDIYYYFKIVFSVRTCCGMSSEIEGLARYHKRCIMYGSEGSAKIYESGYCPTLDDIQRGHKNNAPLATVEVVEPVILGYEVADKCDDNCCCCCCTMDTDSIPKEICPCFDGSMVTDADKRLYVTLGLFSIIRLTRNVQLIIPAYDFCVPEKECCCDSNDENPCELFKKFGFPVDEFFPPKECDLKDDNPCGGCKC